MQMDIRVIEVTELKSITVAHSSVGHFPHVKVYPGTAYLARIPLNSAVEQTKLYFIKTMAPEPECHSKPSPAGDSSTGSINLETLAQWL